MPGPVVLTLFITLGTRPTCELLQSSKEILQAIILEFAAVPFQGILPNWWD